MTIQQETLVVPGSPALKPPSPAMTLGLSPMWHTGFNSEQYRFYFVHWGY